MNNLFVAQSGKINNVSQTNVKNLKDGSQVLVRVIEDKGNGKYEGVIAGVRTSFTAKNAIKPGTSFVANISVQNGKIFLIPKETGTVKNMFVLSEISHSNYSNNLFEQIKDQKTLQFIQQFNLPPDNFSLHLILQMKQLGMKIDSVLLGKIRNISVKFSGKEKKTGDLLLLLAQKGITVSDDELEELLMQIEGNGDTTFDENLKNTSSENNLDRISEEQLKIFFTNIIKSFFGSISEGINQDKIGILTLMNQFKFRQEQVSENNWIILPFEIIDNSKIEDEISGFGSFKLLMDYSKKLQLMKIDCTYKKVNYIFSVKFDKDKISKVKFNVSSKEYDVVNVLNLKENLKKKLDSFSCKTEVEWCESEDIEGTFCDEESFLLFSGEV